MKLLRYTNEYQRLILLRHLAATGKSEAQLTFIIEA